LPRDISVSDRDRAFELLQQATSMAVVSRFLRSKGIAHSAGTWSDLREKRLIPALEDGTLHRSDVVLLLREAEEYGHQHVFLYNCPQATARQIVSEQQVQQALAALGRLDLLQKPPILDKPEHLTLTDVRIESSGAGQILVVKAVQGRSYQKYLREESDDRFVRRIYERVEQRAVNVMRVHQDGFAEVRIQSHNGSADYAQEVDSFWSLVNTIIPQVRFGVLSITKAKEYLWKNRRKLHSSVRYSDSSLRNASGTILSAATGHEQQSLYDDVGASAGLDAFRQVGDAVCYRSDIFWLKRDGQFNQVPSRNIHTILEGAVNEFNVTVQCDRSDYEHVLDQIKKANA